MQVVEQPLERRRPRAVDQMLASAAADPAGEALLQLVDATLAGIVFVAPLVMAGCHPWGRLMLVFLVAMSALLWAFHQARRRRAAWTRTGAEWVLVGGMLLLVLQLLPLPDVWLYSLSPNLPDTLPLWSGSLGSATLTSGGLGSATLTSGALEVGPIVSDGSLSNAVLGTWSQLSLHPEATRGALVMFLTYALLFQVVVQRIQVIEDAERLVRWIALATIFMALLGLFQLLTRNGHSLGFSAAGAALARSVVRGSFGDQNHLAHYLALGVGPLIWWAYQALQPRGHRRRFVPGSGPEPHEQLARLLLLAAFAAVGLTGMLTCSRTGLTAMLLAGIVCGLVYWFHGLSRGGAWWVLLGLGAVVAALLWSYGDQTLTAQSDGPATSTTGTIDAPATGDDPIHVRRRLWQAGMRAVADYPLVGTGAGTLGDVFPIYLSNAPLSGSYRTADPSGASPYAMVLPGPAPIGSDEGRWSLTNNSTGLDMAENSGLRVFQETGLAGFLLLFLGIGVAARACGRLVRRAENRRAVALAGAVAATVATSLLQSFVDQVWSVPACLVVTIILLACGWRVLQLAGGRRPPVPVELPRSAWITMVFVLLAIGLATTHSQLPAALASLDSDRYQTLVDAARQAERQTQKQTERHAERHAERQVERQVERRLLAPWTSDTAAWPDGTTELMRRQLARVVQSYPRNARAHLQLAQVCLAEFDAQQRRSPDALSLSEVREAALAGRFESRAELDAWMARFVGARRSLLWEALDHTHQGLRLCPVQGDGYVQLADLAFLEARSSETRLAYLVQAARVRPDDIHVQQKLAEAGRQRTQR